jgi:hypothetical protein
MEALQKALAAISLALATQAASAAPILINFDDRTGMANSPGALVPLASQLDDDYKASTGAVFSSASPFVAVVNLQACCGNNHTISNPNGIGGVDSLGRLSYGTPFTITFFEAGTGLPGVTDFVQIRGDRIAIAGTATMMAFGFDGRLLASDTEMDSNLGLTLQLSVASIHRVVISETSATIAFDQLEFNAPIAVGEPGALALLVIGLLGLYRLRPPSPELLDVR